MSESFVASLARANMARKNDIDAFVKKTDFDDKPKMLIKKLLQIKQDMEKLKRK